MTAPKPPRDLGPFNKYEDYEDDAMTDKFQPLSGAAQPACRHDGGRVVYLKLWFCEKCGVCMSCTPTHCAWGCSSHHWDKTPAPPVAVPAEPQEAQEHPGVLATRIAENNRIRAYRETDFAPAPAPLPPPQEPSVITFLQNYDFDTMTKVEAENVADYLETVAESLRVGYDEECQALIVEAVKGITRGCGREDDGSPSDRHEPSKLDNAGSTPATPSTTRPAALAGETAQEPSECVHEWKPRGDFDLGGNRTEVKCVKCQMPGETRTEAQAWEVKPHESGEQILIKHTGEFSFREVAVFCDWNAVEDIAADKAEVLAILDGAAAAASRIAQLERERDEDVSKLVNAIVEVVHGCDPRKEEAQLRHWLTRRLTNLATGKTYKEECHEISGESL